MSLAAFAVSEFYDIQTSSEVVGRYSECSLASYLTDVVFSNHFAQEAKYAQRKVSCSRSFYDYIYKTFVRRVRENHKVRYFAQTLYSDSRRSYVFCTAVAVDTIANWQVVAATFRREKGA